MSAVPLGAAAPPVAPRRQFIIAGLALALPLAILLRLLPIGAPAALAGLGLFLLVVAIGQARIETHHPPARLGAANGVTLLRAAGAGLIAALALDPEPAASWELVAATALLVGLDGIDGMLARRQRLASAFGARFDMEVDALTILALSGLAVGLGKAGPWILAIGLMRYAFVLAGWALPILARPLPRSMRRKTVCALQLAVLTLLLAPPVVPPLSAALAAFALAALTVSFAIDLAWLVDARAQLGLIRSLVIYRARPWRIARLARFYAGLLRPGDLAFDIGAHAGNRTLALRAAGARVVALEPQGRFHRFLRRTLPREITLLPVAAGAAQGRAELAVSRLHPTVSSLAPGFAERLHTEPGFAHVRWDGHEDVAVTTLDALIAAHGIPRFVKIDTEGFEAEVLRGLSHPVAWIAFEHLPATPDLARACLARIGALGDYRFNLVEGEDARFALADWQDARAMAITLATRRRSGDVYARHA